MFWAADLFIPAQAVRKAINSARADNGVHEWYELPVPATPDEIQRACAYDTSKLTV